MSTKVRKVHNFYTENEDIFTAHISIKMYNPGNWGLKGSIKERVADLVHTTKPCDTYFFWYGYDLGIPCYLHILFLYFLHFFASAAPQRPACSCHAKPVGSPRGNRHVPACWGMTDSNLDCRVTVWCATNEPPTTSPIFLSGLRILSDTENFNGSRSGIYSRLISCSYKKEKKYLKNWTFSNIRVSFQFL